MTVSLIIPIYKGNKYIDGLIRMADCNQVDISQNNANIQIEVVLVNDFPDIPLNSEELSKEHEFGVVILNNKENQGIHQSRVNGIMQATGEYILMLDQDDMIYDYCIRTQCAMIGNADMIIGNGYKMFGDRKKEIYKSEKKHKLSLNENIYLYAANQIVSPGHCLIKKSSIPNEWFEYIVENNGGDDLFLWILMFAKGCKFAINRELIYTHNDTGINLSLDLDKMYRSSDQVIALCQKSGLVSEKKIKIYERRIRYLREIQSKSKMEKIFACIRNFDLCLYKLYAYYR